MSKLRVVLAEDHFLLRRGLSDVVDAEETLELAGVCQVFPSCWTQSSATARMW